jgi:meiosis arrest female protein 1
VYVQAQPDNTSIGFVKVPTVDDARYLISQFHRKKIGYKRIHVSLVSNNPGTAAANIK